MGRGEGTGARVRGSEGQVGLLVAFAGRGPFWIFLLRSNFPYAASPTSGDLGNPEGVRIPDSLGPSLALVSCVRLFSSARNQRSSLTAAPRAPPGLGHLGPSHSPSLSFPRAGRSGLRVAHPGALGVAVLPPLQGASVARLCLLKGLRVLWPVGRGPRLAAVPGFRLALACGRDRSSGNVSRPDACCLWPLGRPRPPGKESLCEMQEAPLPSCQGSSRGGPVTWPPQCSSLQSGASPPESSAVWLHIPGRSKPVLSPGMDQIGPGL